MGHRARLATFALVGAALILASSGAAARSAGTGPQEAAARIIHRLKPNFAKCDCEAAWSKVISRSGALWFAFYDKKPSGSAWGPERLRIFRWTGTRWNRDADVSWRGWGSALGFITAARLTGSTDPDFVIAGCGAADTICLSIVSDVGGRWHAVPFEYGYGREVVVNGFPHGRLVQTQVNACSCALGPSSWLYERYANGAFRPANWPGRALGCGRDELAFVANGENSSATPVSFDRAVCRDGWAIAIGTGSGYSGRVVGLFNRELGHRQAWRLVALEDPAAVAAAPALFDLPPRLLRSLAGRLGAPLVPTVRATSLIARLHARYELSWPSHEGYVAAGGELWLVAVMPRRHRAIVYRWSGRSWFAAGRVGGLPRSFELPYYGDWLVSVPAPRPYVAFAPVGSLHATVLTNAGGRWHLGSARR